MFLKIPIYVEVEGSLADPSALSESLRSTLEYQILGKSEKTGKSSKISRWFVLSEKNLEYQKEFGNFPERLRYLTYEKVLEKMRSNLAGKDKD